MVMTDFEYNGELLSEHGCIPGSVISSTEENQSMGSTLTLNTIQIRNRNHLTSTKYEEVLTKTFDIIKNPCESNDYEFTEEEIAKLMVWLQRKEYFKFTPVYDDGQYADLCFYGIFTAVSSIYIGGKIVGFSLTFTTDSPYGYVEYEEETFTLTSSDSTFKIYNDSQEYGHLYFESMSIKCLGAGDIYLSNTTDDSTRYTVIKNCSANEVITIDCEHEFITSSASHSTLMNDFNYNFPRLFLDYSNIYNTFSYNSSKISGLQITVKYKAIRKVGVIA